MDTYYLIFLIYYALCKKNFKLKEDIDENVDKLQKRLEKLQRMGLIDEGEYAMRP